MNNWPSLRKLRFCPLVYDLRTDIEDIHQLYVLEALVFHFWKQLLRITSSSNDSEQKDMFLLLSSRERIFVNTWVSKQQALQADWSLQLGNRKKQERMLVIEICRDSKPFVAGICCCPQRHPRLCSD
jgi:hypothetical protein